MADGQDAIELRRRARRRLVGAIALVVFVVIALPIVLDREPKQISQDLTIQIPSQDAGTFSSRALPAPVERPPKAVESPPLPAAGPQPATQPAAEASKPGPASGKTAPAETTPSSVAGTSSKEKAPEAAKESAKPAAPKTAEPSGAPSYVVPLGVFTKSDNVKQVRSKASAAGFKTFTEPMAGTDRIRVRAGPFSTRKAAEAAREKMKKAGLDVGGVVAR